LKDALLAGIITPGVVSIKEIIIAGTTIKKRREKGLTQEIT
jgi:hypothetical protein